MVKLAIAVGLLGAIAGGLLGVSALTSAGDCLYDVPACDPVVFQIDVIDNVRLAIIATCLVIPSVNVLTMAWLVHTLKLRRKGVTK